MTWTDLTFPSGSKLTSTKMTQVQSNFAALAGGEPGAPSISVDSLMWSGVASGAFLHVSSGMVTSEAGSFGSISANSGFHTTGVGSFGSISVNSGYHTTGVGSFGGMVVSSAMTIHGAAPSPPTANTLYKENVPKAWISLNGTGTIAIKGSFNVLSITDLGAGNYQITWDTDFSDVNYGVFSSCRAGESAGANFGIGVVTGGALAGSVEILIENSGGTDTDLSEVYVMAMGEQ